MKKYSIVLILLLLLIGNISIYKAKENKGPCIELIYHNKQTTYNMDDELALDVIYTNSDTSFSSIGLQFVYSTELFKVSSYKPSQVGFSMFNEQFGTTNTTLKTSFIPNIVQTDPSFNVFTPGKGLIATLYLKVNKKSSENTNISLIVDSVNQKNSLGISNNITYQLGSSNLTYSYKEKSNILCILLGITFPTVTILLIGSAFIIIKRKKQLTNNRSQHEENE
jgi:hypothetical protein